MIGKIVEAHLKWGAIKRPPGGEIRIPGLLERIPFEPSALIGLRFGDCLGQEVYFDVLDGAAVRVRPVRALATNGIG